MRTQTDSGGARLPAGRRCGGVGPISCRAGVGGERLNQKERAVTSQAADRGGGRRKEGIGRSPEEGKLGELGSDAGSCIEVVLHS